MAGFSGRKAVVLLAAMATLAAGCGHGHSTAAPTTTTKAAHPAQAARTIAKKHKRPTPSTTTTPPTSTTTSTTAPATTTTSTPTTTAPAAPVSSVDWQDVALPGSTCYSATPIQLQDGRATIPAPASIHAGTADLLIEAGPVLFGDFFGPSQDVAAVNVMCSNTGGTADGELLSTWVVFDMDGSSPNAIGVLTPQQASAPGTHAPLLTTDITITPGQIVVPERYYTATNETCCPTGQATTTWAYRNGTLGRGLDGGVTAREPHGVPGRLH